jgi:3-methyl-2-oxobutanoate hydroxymethyltransferase
MHRVIDLLRLGSAGICRRRFSETASKKPTPIKRVTVTALQRQFERKEPIVTVTAYDAPMAALADSHADVILVGDSVGMVMLGYSSTVPVTLNAMALFCAAAARGTKRALLVGDLPFGSYATENIARMSAIRMVQEGGANAVKLEGGRSQSKKIQAICNEGIPVMGHVGLLPQTSPLSSGGSYVVQGKSGISALSCVYDAIAAQEAGAFAVVLEVVPAQISAFITGLLKIPTIGIGAGPSCGGQVLVAHDLLGFSQSAASTSDGKASSSTLASGSPIYGSSSSSSSSNTLRQPRFVRRYANIGADINLAFRDFAHDVRGRSFPSSSTPSSSSSSISKHPYTHLNSSNSLTTHPQHVVQNEFFDMELNELKVFKSLVQRDFPTAFQAHEALDAATIELEMRLGGKASEFQPSSISVKASSPLSDKEVISSHTHKHPIDSSTPPSSLSVAILGSGAIASLISAALGTNKRINRLSMFSSWSERLDDVRKRGGIRFRRPLLQNSDVETVCSSLELYDLSDLSKSSIGASAKELEAFILHSLSSSSPSASSSSPSSLTSSKDVSPPFNIKTHNIDSSVKGCFDLVLLCGKAYQVESQAALAALLVKPRDGLVVPFYNGSDSLEYLSSVFSLLNSYSKEVHQGQVLYGQTSLGARYERDGSGSWILEHTGNGQTLVFNSGNEDSYGKSSFIDKSNSHKNNSNTNSDLILSAMQVGPADGLGDWPLQTLFKPHNEFQLARWRKVAVNSVLNPICALLGVTNGGFVEAARGLYKKQVHALAAEAACAIEVNCEGSSVTPQEILELVHSVSIKTSYNTNSLLADFKTGRDLEAPFINGAIIRSLSDKKRERAPANAAILSALEARTVALFGETHASRASSRAMRIISSRWTPS